MKGLKPYLKLKLFLNWKKSDRLEYQLNIFLIICQNLIKIPVISYSDIRVLKLRETLRKYISLRHLVLGRFIGKIKRSKPCLFTFHLRKYIDLIKTPFCIAPYNRPFRKHPLIYYFQYSFKFQNKGQR